MAAVFLLVRKCVSKLEAGFAVPSKSSVCACLRSTMTVLKEVDSKLLNRVSSSQSFYQPRVSDQDTACPNGRKVCFSRGSEPFDRSSGSPKTPNSQPKTRGPKSPHSIVNR